MNVAEYKLSKDSARPMVRMNYVDAVLPDDIAKLLITRFDRRDLRCGTGAGILLRRGRNTFDRGSAAQLKNDLVPSPGNSRINCNAWLSAPPALPPPQRCENSITILIAIRCHSSTAPVEVRLGVLSWSAERVRWRTAILRSLPDQ